jgi:imidazolonepropionase-like amidohydrolase
LGAPELLAEAIGSMAAIKAVTATAARYLRQQNNLGMLAPGRYADLLVVDSDPVRCPRTAQAQNGLSQWRRHDPLLAKVSHRHIDQAAQ